MLEDCLGSLWFSAQCFLFMINLPIRSSWVIDYSIRIRKALLDHRISILSSIWDMVFSMS